MNAKELERFLANLGASATQVDVVTRRMRAAFNVSTGGRGVNAASLRVDEIAWILCAFAGSDIAAKADQTFATILKLQSPDAKCKEFVIAMQLILRGEITDVQEVRICRNMPLAKILYTDGNIERFVSTEYLQSAGGFGEASFRSEGVISGGLIKALRLELEHENETGEMVAG